MITVPTVLVLGAGASVPYGFPTAAELQRRICETFAAADSRATQFLAQKYDHSPREFVAFTDALRQSGRQSVDEFLEHRRDFIEVGKLAIAYCLIPYEDEGKLFTLDRGIDWYQYLFKKLNAPFDEFANNTLSVVTFNYDRSLEQYLLTVLRNAYGRTVEECQQTVARIPIVHVYGQLSRIPYPQPRSRPYLPDPEYTDHFVGNAAAGIKILHEAEPLLEEAHALLREAQMICFLGFSYHRLNVQRLALRNATSRRIVFGSALGFVDSEIGEITGRLREALLCSNITLDRADNLLTLRQHRVFG
jgi:hypothetical protein